jgi:hypothetical protein
MSETITLTFSGDVLRAIEEVCLREGVSREQLVGRAVEEHLFLRRFRTLRDRMVERARDQGITTDEDVFDRVS